MQSDGLLYKSALYFYTRFCINILIKLISVWRPFGKKSVLLSRCRLESQATSQRS